MAEPTVPFAAVLPLVEPRTPNENSMPVVRARAGQPVETTATAKRTGDVVIHEYDGVQEYDNDLPNWWLNAWFGTIIFAAGYYFHYQVFQSGESQAQAYHREMQSVYAADAVRLRASRSVTPAALLALSRDDDTVHASTHAHPWDSGLYLQHRDCGD